MTIVELLRELPTATTVRMNGLTIRDWKQTDCGNLIRFSVDTPDQSDVTIAYVPNDAKVKWLCDNYWIVEDNKRRWRQLSFWRMSPVIV